MKIALNNEEKEILTNILLEELNRIRKYEYLILALLANIWLCKWIDNPPKLIRQLSNIHNIPLFDASCDRDTQPLVTSTIPLIIGVR